jgi:osmoprotectant transport system permease protein
MRRRLGFLLAVLFALAAAPAQSDEQPLRIGSKRFTESYVLAEILARTAATRTRAVHVPGLGNTAIVFEALRQGSIDLYPEYLGTIELEILKLGEGNHSLEDVNRHLAPLGLAASVPLGFSNNYALAVRADVAGELKVATVGELAAHRELRFGLSHEFLGRADGWPGLKARYGLPQEPRGLDHGLAYEALASGTIDVTDVYSTDAKISRYGLRVLDDELRFFPRYDAVVLHRRDLPERFPQAWSALSALAGSIDADRMIALNAAAELQGKSFAEVAQAFLADLQRSGEVRSAGETPAATTRAEAGAGAAIDAAVRAGPVVQRRLWQALAAGDFWRLAAQHLLLVFVSVGAAVLVAVPAGIAAVLLPRFGSVLLAVVGAVQTIPSLALLALLVTGIGSIGTLPALVALFAYALLPIVRNVVVGIQGIAPGTRDAAAALGLRPRQRMALIELPLALPVIVAGIRVAAVISVGTATIAAFVGAGGFGERIVTGLALNDRQLLLAGALPAAGLAFLMEALFALLQRRISRWSA